MNTAGIVCEYNPFHNGHKYLIEQTKKLLGDDCAVVCVMSGNFVQRGDFAMFNKHARAAAAVRSGADLVLELPVPWAVASAEKFARGSVEILNSIGICTHLAFGSESGSVDDLKKAAITLESKEFVAYLKDQLDMGLSFASARQKALEMLLGDDAYVISQPNNILAVEYLKALHNLNSKMVPIAIKRVGAEHDSCDEADDIISASQIRKLIAEGNDVSPYIPKEAFEIFSGEISFGRAPVTIGSAESAILAKLRTMTETDYKSLPDAGEGLYMRFMKAAKTEPTVEKILESVKTKRYAMSRLRRMVICAYLGVKEGVADGSVPYARVLALSAKGAELLKNMKDRSHIPVITKTATVKNDDSRTGELIRLEAAATDLYSLAYPFTNQRAGGKEWTTSPVVIKSR